MNVNIQHKRQSLEKTAPQIHQKAHPTWQRFKFRQKKSFFRYQNQKISQWSDMHYKWSARKRSQRLQNDANRIGLEESGQRSCDQWSMLLWAHPRCRMKTFSTSVKTTPPHMCQCVPRHILETTLGMVKQQEAWSKPLCKVCKTN